MKNIRIFALLLCLVFAFSMLAACGGDPVVDPGKNPGGNGNTTTTPLDAYAGDTFTLIGAWFPKNERDYTEEEREQAAANGPQELTVEQEAMANRILALEEKYNITIVAEGSQYWGISGAEFGAMVAAGEVEADMFHGELAWGRDMFIGGYIAPVSEYSSIIDVTDVNKWGSASLQQATTYKGQQWGFPWHGSAHMAIPYIYYGQLLVSNPVYNSFELDSTVQELVEAEQWTFETFKNLIPQVSNTDPQNQIYGLAYYSDFAMLAVYANGGDRVVWDEAQGKYVYGLNKPNAVAAVEWAVEIADMMEYTTLSTEWKGFVEGKYTFFFTNGNRIFGDIFKRTDDFQFVPFPYGPDVEYGSTSAIYIQWNDSASGIFDNEDDDRVQASAFLFNEMTEKLEADTMPDGYQAFLFRNNFAEGDTFSFNVYEKHGLNIHWSFEPDLGSLYGNITTALNRILNNGQSTSTLNNLEAAVNEQLDLTVNPD